MYYYVLIVFSLRRESLKLILATDPFRGGSVTRMKVDIAKYVASCGICQKVKAEHKRSAGLLKPLEIPE
jgi:hypothetical protein